MKKFAIPEAAFNFWAKSPWFIRRKAFHLWTKRLWFIRRKAPIYNRRGFISIQVEAFNLLRSKLLFMTRPCSLFNHNLFKLLNPIDMHFSPSSQIFDSWLHIVPGQPVASVSHSTAAFRKRMSFRPVRYHRFVNQQMPWKMK